MMKRIIHQMIDTHEIWGFSDLNLRLCSSHNRLFPQTVNFVHEACKAGGASPVWYPKSSFHVSLI
jgi:hypothetical protein